MRSDDDDDSAVWSRTLTFDDDDYVDYHYHPFYDIYTYGYAWRHDVDDDDYYCVSFYVPSPYRPISFRLL